MRSIETRVGTFLKKGALGLPLCKDTCRCANATRRLFVYVVARIVPDTDSADLSGMDQRGADGSATHEIYEGFS